MKLFWKIQCRFKKWILTKNQRAFPVVDTQKWKKWASTKLVKKYLRRVRSHLPWQWRLTTLSFSRSQLGRKNICCICFTIWPMNTYKVNIFKKGKNAWGVEYCSPVFAGPTWVINGRSRSTHARQTPDILESWVFDLTLSPSFFFRSAFSESLLFLARFFEIQGFWRKEPSAVVYTNHRQQFCWWIFTPNQDLQGQCSPQVSGGRQNESTFGFFEDWR